MSDAASSALPTPTNYQHTAGGHLQWQPPTPEHLQEMLPAYEVLSILGQGGMGAVYKGRQKSLDRVVAIKILPPEAAEDDMQFVERFKNEARTMAKMNHPAIVHVYDFGETTEGQLYIVMEFIDGTDVAKMIQSQGKLPEDYALSITAHVCDALGYAHTHGVVHRDIKPANVLINMDGQVKVADFGLAKATDPSQMGLTKTNMAMGTPDFVSPEALMPGVPLDGRADLYAVGVMLYNMLTGTIPRGAFRMPSATLQTDARFDQIIQKAMEMDRERRYQTALDLRRDLDVILTTPAAKSDGQTIPAQAALPQKPMGKSPGPPQGKEGSAGTPARSVPPADKNARTHQTADKSVRAPVAPAKKSNAVMIYGIAAAVAVIAVAIFLFSGGEKKPAAAPKAVAETKPEPKKPETKPATPPPSKPTPKPTESKPAPAPAAVASGNEKWVDGLAQWFGGTKTNEDFIRENNGGARIGGTARSLQPIPSSTTGFRDQAVRMRWRGANPTATGDLRVYVRLSKEASGKEVSYAAAIRPAKEVGWAVRLLGAKGGSEVLGGRDWGLPADFKIDAPHTMELRVVGDLLTATVDGKKIAEARDSTLTAGRPAFSGHDLVLESFEYANLDPGGSAPASPIATTTKPGDMRTFTGHRYQFHAGPFIKDEARDLASSLGGHLVTITSAAEQAWIEATFAELIGGPKKTGLCLTGGAQGCEKWSNGEPWGYTNWKTDISKAKSDFLVLSQDGGKCPWQPTFWTQPTSAIVEWNDDKSVPALASAKPGDVLTFGGHRYQLVMEKLSWEAAKAKAEAMGGHLATITSPEENDWMLKNITVPGEVLLGGSQAVKNGPWKWVTGEAFDLKLWGRSGPDGSGDKVAYDAASKHWDDVPTTHPVIVGFLVEWDSDAPAKPASPDGWQDALALVDLSRDDPKGDWQRDGHSLKPPAGEISMCAIPIVPAPSYDLRVRVRREGDAAGIWVAFTKQEHAGCFVIDCNPAKPNGPRHAGLEMLKGKHVWDTEQVVERPEWLKKGLNEIIMQVRDEGLVAFLDGKEIYRWKGNWADLSLPPGWWEKGKAPAFSLRNWRGKMTFEDISWRPVVEEKGGALASALPATPAAAPAPAPTMPAAAPAPAPAAPVAPADPRLAQLAAGFKARHEADALQPFNTALAALNTSYVANGVSRARTAAKAKGSLAEVTALDAEKTAIEQGRGVPAEDDSDTVESLKTLRVTYRTAHAKFAAERDAKAAPLYDLYLKALDAYIAELTQADKIDAARKVQVFRDDIALQKPAAGAAAPPATPTAPASSAAAKPTTRAPKMNEHEVAEWAIAAGGSVEVLFGTPPVRRSIAIATELPRGRFVIFEMRVNCAKVLGNDLSPLASAQDVGRLHLDNSPPDKTFLDLTPLRQMTALRDVRCSDQDAAAVDVIASLSELTTLYVGKMPEGSLEKIAKLKQLSSFGSPSITGPGIAALKSCKKLHDIRSEGTASDEDVRALAAALPDLDYLVVSGPALTNACIPSVLSLKSLNSLTLDSDELDDSVIEPLGKLPNLSVLKLHSSKVVGSNLDVLKKFSSLRELYLDGCSITDDALDVLVQLKGLTKLQLRDTKVTDAGIAKFKAARPDCEVTK